MATTMIEKRNVEEEIKNSDIPVLIEFYADWCNSCKMLSPIIDQISEEITEQKIIKVNVEEYPELSEEFGIKSVPTFILYKNGKVESKSYGAKSKITIMKMLKG